MSAYLTIDRAQSKLNDIYPNPLVRIDYSVNGGVYKFCIYFLSTSSPYRLFFAELKNIRIIKNQETAEEVVNELVEKLRKYLPNE